jgi:hypothetical protein
MRFTTTAAMLIISAFCLAGCGGGSGGGGGGLVGATDKYAGTYAGTYENQLGDTGPFAFTVGSTGTIANGTITISGTSVSLTGSVTSSGSATFIPGGNNPSSSGKLSAAGGTTITGTLKDNAGDTFWVEALYDPTGAVAGANPFSNDYSGDFKNNTKGDTGIDSFFVDGSGNITGTGLIDISGTIEFAIVGGSVSNTGALTLTFKVNGALITTITGNVALANSSMTGNLTNTAGDSLTLDVQAVN